MIRLQIMLPEDIHEKLREEAHQKRVSIAQLVRDALIKQYPDWRIFPNKEG